jgi:hypothetical protein
MNSENFKVATCDIYLFPYIYKVTVNVKVKFTLEQATKAVQGK